MGTWVIYMLAGNWALKKDVMEVNNVYDNPKYVKVREALTVQLEKLRKDVGVTE